MRTSGVDDLKAALRRSLWLFIVLPIIGAAAMTAARQSQDPKFEATARVVLPQAELAATLAGVPPVYVDPDRADEAEENLGSARGLYVRASEATGGLYGTGPFLRSVTQVDADNNLVEFASSTNDESGAIAIATAVAREYPEWRADAFRRTIDRAIQQIRAQLRSGSSESLAEQLQRLNVLKTLNSGETAIIEPAEGAAQVSPLLIRDAVLGAAIGFVVALLIAGLRELLDTRVRTEADVEEAIGVPVLATIQNIPKRSRSRAVMADPRFADSYELLAANLAQILEDEERPTYIAVTSADPGEGKTTTSANLALALARRGQDVVLADFDLRKPQLGTLFSVPNDATGVSDVLRGDATVTSTLWPIALGAVGTTRGRVPAAARTGGRGNARVAPPRMDGEGSLLLLPAGHSTGGGTGGTFSRLPKLLDSLEPVAEFVIIDTPPALLTAGVAELAQTMNAVLVVVRQGTATRRRLRALGSRSHTWRSKMIGAVLNGAAGDERYSSYYGSE